MVGKLHICKISCHI